MSDQKGPPVLAFPIADIQKIYADAVEAKSMASSYIKLYAPEVGLEAWDQSQLPLLSDVYSYSSQLHSFLNQKIEHPTEQELLAAAQFGEDAIPFLYEEVMMMSGVVGMIEKNKKLLLVRFNISFEVH